jgi:hypothetical protein
LLKLGSMLRFLSKLRASRLATAIAAIALFAGLGGCTTPQIPLPPPNTDNFTMSVREPEQQIRLQGSAGLSGGQIFIEDALGNGIFRRVDGDAKFDTGWFRAPDGEVLRISVTDGDNRSDPICRQVDYASKSLKDVPCP